MDTFNVQWSQCFLCSPPPFSVITRTLQKIQQDQATGLLVANFWTTQTSPLLLPKRKNTLYLPQDPSAVHPLHSQMSLLLRHLSGNICRVKEFHNQLLTLSCSPGGPAQEFTTRSALPKYREVWDVNTVLEHLKTLHPAETLSLKLWSLKIVILMAVLSGQRCQTIHALTSKDMKTSNNKVMFIVNDLLKTSKPGKECTKLEFQSFDEDPRNCVVRYLSEHLGIQRDTKNLRHDHHKLLVSSQKPHRPVSKDTVSRWFKMGFKLTGIDSSTFSAHSTRAASTSAAKAQKLSNTTIMATAGWSSENTLTKYYNKTISKATDNFGKQLVKAL
ncbi:unnamed protein product, partial [Porites evermanni]